MAGVLVAVGSVCGQTITANREHSRPSGTWINVTAKVDYVQIAGTNGVWQQISGNWYEIHPNATTSGDFTVGQGSWSANPGPISYVIGAPNKIYAIGPSYAQAIQSPISVPVCPPLKGNVSLGTEIWNWITVDVPVTVVTLDRTAGTISWENPVIDDSDGDGIPDYQDPDDDNDGIPDGQDPDHPDYEPPDSDNDGIPDDTDPDDDGDGVPDEDDSDHPSYKPDMDGDGIPDSEDPDRDGDGILNPHDPDPDWPFDPPEIDPDDDPDGDADGDGTNNDEDPDDDNDGISDDNDTTPRGPGGGTWNPPPGAPTGPDVSGDGGTAAMNGLQEGGHGLEGTGKPTGDPIAGLKNVGGTARGKFEGFRLTADAGGLPRATQWTKTLSFGSLGTKTWTIDLQAPHFIALRYAILAIFTVICGIAFLKRATI